MAWDKVTFAERTKEVVVSTRSGIERVATYLRSSGSAVTPIILRQWNTTFDWVGSLDPFRYTIFEIRNGRNEAAIRKLEESFQQEMDAVSKWHREERDRIDAGELTMKERLLDWEKKKVKNQQLPESQQVEIPYYQYDPKSLAEISQISSSYYTALNVTLSTREGAVKWPLAGAREAAATFRTEFWLAEARRYVIPLPAKDDEMWAGRNLTAKGDHTLRTLVRKERRERFESIQIKVALLVSFVTLGLGIWNASHR